MARVRVLREGDVPEVLAMMRALAAFEGYLEDFRVGEGDLLRFGFGEERRFTCLVAEGAGAEGLVGFAVLHEDRWNYQMRPTFVLKELYVRAEARGRGVGAALFGAAEAHCRSAGAVRLRWLVLGDNEGAERFYRRLGGARSAQWRLWSLPRLSS